MKYDYEAELPTRHHWVYPSGALTDIQKEVTAANPLTTARRRRAVVRQSHSVKERGKNKLSQFVLRFVSDSTASIDPASAGAVLQSVCRRK